MHEAGSRAALAVSRLRFESLAEELQALMRQDAWQVGDRLPAERDLCARFEVSRGTVRRAMQHLRSLGLIESGPKGWRVTQPPLGEPDVLLSFSEMAARAGVETTSTVLAKRIRLVTRDESDDLTVATGSALFELTRLRKFDGVPVGIEVTRLPAHLGPFHDVDFETQSLYGFLRSHGVHPIRAHYAVSARAATPWEAALLDVPPESPLVTSDAMTHDASGRTIELSRSIFRADRYTFHATLST